MHRAVLILCLVLCASHLVLAQAKSTKAKHSAIQIAKAALISAFDSNLPRISLEYFLNYEAAGAPVGWESMVCPVTHPARTNSNDQVCVVATIEVHDRRVAMVSVAVGGIAKNPGGAVELRSVMITDESGVVRKLPLIELPAAIHRMRPRMPQLDVTSGTLA